LTAWGRPRKNIHAAFEREEGLHLARMRKNAATSSDF
jgi:hypothetical protein